MTHKEKAKFWLLEAQRLNGDWTVCPGWFPTKEEAQEEVQRRSQGRYRIIYRVSEYKRVEVTDQPQGPGGVV